MYSYSCVHALFVIAIYRLLIFTKVCALLVQEGSHTRPVQLINLIKNRDETIVMLNNNHDNNNVMLKLQIYA